MNPRTWVNIVTGDCYIHSLAQGVSPLPNGVSIVIRDPALASLSPVAGREKVLPLYSGALTRSWGPICSEFHTQLVSAVQ